MGEDSAMAIAPEIGGSAPLLVEVVAGQSYWWCACGRSKTQPFCDGSHAGTPIEWTAPASKRVLFCACKRSAKRPFCDGTHKTL